MKVLRKLLLLVSVILGSIFLTSCKAKTNIEGKPFVDGDFEFSLLENSDELTIIGLSEEGKTKETLVLPTMVNGKKVTTLGYEYYNPLYPTRELRIDFSGASFKNFYVHSLIKKCERDVGNKVYGISNELCFYYPSFLKPSARGICCSKPNQGYTTEKSKKDLLEQTPNAIWPTYYKSVNVIYFMNDDTDEVFFVDDCDGTKVNVMPPNPYRDGYEFKGWYKEKECINLFDFENEIIPEKEYDEKGNYILKETNIYAKWEVLK